MFQLSYHALDCRTVAQIQRSAVEPKKRNPISRIFHAKKDEATIAAWRSNLDRILHVFEVRSIERSLVTPLTVRLQTELALHTNVAVSDIREDVANTRELVSDMHRTMLKGQEGADVRDQTVGNRVLPMIQNSYNCLDSTKVCNLSHSRRPWTLSLSPADVENHLPRHREPVSDGRI